ncbi:hypothetical protein QJS66_13880 [Kocuria rhizophila]|nr:hypothetical protein QJS66_13880 [Kocuria rhizophila]
MVLKSPPRACWAAVTANASPTPTPPIRSGRPPTLLAAEELAAELFPDLATARPAGIYGPGARPWSSGRAAALWPTG